MLEKPTIPDDKITAALQTKFGLSIAQLTFLPLGADMGNVAIVVS